MHAYNTLSTLWYAPVNVLLMIFLGKSFQLIIPYSLFSVVSLRHLCVHDKQRVNQLIEELATAEREKASAKIELDRERGQFRDALIQLNHQMLLLERERNDILLCQKLYILVSKSYRTAQMQGNI